MADWDRSSERPPPSAAVVFLQVSLGIGSVFVGHAVFLGLLALVAGLASNVNQVAEPAAAFGMFGLFGLSCAQVIYVIPMLVGAVLVRRPIALGVIVGAVLTGLLQTTCYGVFMLGAVA